MAINSFVDQDMLMRHFGHGIGHLKYRPQTQQDSATETVSGTMMGDADLISDNDTGSEQEDDIEVDIEEEGGFDGELYSDVDCDSASTVASEDESEWNNNDSDNYSDGYASF
jgi:hypothetical protein